MATGLGTTITISSELQKMIGDLVLQIAGRPTLRVALPNLQVVEGIILDWYPNTLQISPTIANVGNARSDECMVQADVRLSNSNGPIGTRQVTVRCPALEAESMTSVDFPILEGIEEGWTASITVTVDPPTPGKPGGEVWESNEEDNSRTTGILCRIITPGNLPVHNGGTDPPIDPLHHHGRKAVKRR